MSDATETHAAQNSGAWDYRDLQLDGARLCYATAGTGEPVLLLHGYPQSRLCWRQHIGPLAESYHVVAPDWLGWGESERRLDIAPRYHDEVRRLGRLIEALDLAPVNLIAHDYGGLLALGYVIQQPEAVRRFVILNSRAHGTFKFSFYVQVAIQSFAARRGLLRPLLASAPMGAIHRRAMRKYIRLGCFSEEILEQYIGWMDSREGRAWLAHFYRYYELAPRVELASELANIACPTAVIWGDADPFIPWSTAEDLAAAIPSAELTRLAGADHFVMEERPDEVLAAIQTLLQSEVN